MLAWQHAAAPAPPSGLVPILNDHAQVRMNPESSGPIPHVQGSSSSTSREKVLVHQKKAAPHVLVVDDERLLLWAIAETLRSRGVVVDEASNAKEALRALTSEERVPEAVLLDLNLPDSHDLGLVRMVRTLVPAARVFLMTAFGSPEVRSEARQLGVVDILDKPFDFMALDGLVACATS
jgi:CheY-like chemotaxis protein